MSARFSIFEISDCPTLRIFASAVCVNSRAARSSSRRISSTMRRNSRSLSARAAGDIFSRSSLNFLAIFRSLPFQLFEMFVVQAVGNRHVDLVPAVVSCFVAAHEQDRVTFRIEPIKHSQRASLSLNAKLAHVPVTRTLHAGTHRVRQVWDHHLLK